MKKAKKKYDLTGSIRISTTVSSGISEKYRQFNHNKAEYDKITWADCIRRGFKSIFDEKRDKDVSDILDSEYVPIQVKDRVRRLSEKLGETLKQLDMLKSGTGIVEIRPEIGANTPVFEEKNPVFDGNNPVLEEKTLFLKKKTQKLEEKTQK